LRSYINFHSIFFTLDGIEKGSIYLLTKINAEVMLPFNNEQKLARVKARSTNINGNLIGTHNSNPFLNTSTYDVEFSDHIVKQFGANVIAQNLYSQVDKSGRSQRLLANILDSQRDHTAVSKSDMCITTSSGQQRMGKSTIDWKLLVQKSPK
jgi:hypothetical protein